MTPLLYHDTLLLACGALAHDLLAWRDAHNWHVDILCAPLLLHNTPGKIASVVAAKIRALQADYARIIVVYGDCGTSGALDAALDDLGVQRIRGDHCFAQFGGPLYDQIMNDAPGTFFLTDFLVRSFEALVWKNLGLDRHPELLTDYFGNYTQAVYLVQDAKRNLAHQAVVCAARLQLPLRVVHVGGGDVEKQLSAMLSAL